MNRHDKIFDVLHKFAEANEPGVNNYRLAAALVYRNEIISFGKNQKKTHPFQKRFAKNDDAIFLHAEVDCIARALSNHYHPDIIAKSRLYVLRLRYVDRKDKSFIRASAKPCKGCMRAIARFDIQKVYYTTDNGDYEIL